MSKTTKRILCVLTEREGKDGEPYLIGHRGGMRVHGRIVNETAGGNPIWQITLQEPVAKQQARRGYHDRKGSNTWRNH